MSPIVTLYVGQESTKFHVHENTLCKLPFFKAALQGQFREASDKIMRLPEDNPEAFSVLVEHLIVGGCSFSFDTVKLQRIQENLGRTPETQEHELAGEQLALRLKELVKGAFYIQVYVIADKYDCPELCQKVQRIFRDLTADFPALDILHILKFAYTADINISTLGIGSTPKQMEIIKSWTHTLFKENPEEMRRTMLEFPVLSCDLLNIATMECN